MGIKDDFNNLDGFSFYLDVVLKTDTVEYKEFNKFVTEYSITLPENEKNLCKKYEGSFFHKLANSLGFHPMIGFSVFEDGIWKTYPDYDHDICSLSSEEYESFIFKELVNVVNTIGVVSGSLWYRRADEVRKTYLEGVDGKLITGVLEEDEEELNERTELIPYLKEYNSNKGDVNISLDLFNKILKL